MGRARKWKKHLVSVDFPNCGKLSDDKILELIYESVSGREDLLKWLAYQINGEDENFLKISRDGLVKFFCEHGLLKVEEAESFLDAKQSEKEQKINWKTLFSFARMRKFFRSSSALKKKQDSQKFYYRRRKIRDFDDDTESENNINLKNEELKKCLLKEEREKQQNDADDKALERYGEEEMKPSHIHCLKGNRYKAPHKPMFYTPDIDEFFNEYETNVDETDKTPHYPMISGDEPFPRIYIPAGAPALGGLSKDLTQFKVKFQDSVTPITVDGEPYDDHSMWDCTIFEIK